MGVVGNACGLSAWSAFVVAHRQNPCLLPSLCTKAGTLRRCSRLTIMSSSSDASATQATRYKTFTIPWPKGSGSNLTTVPLTFAIGHSLPTRWFLHRPFCYSPWGDADSGPSEYISYNFPFPHPKSKHPVIPWLPRTKEHDEIIIKGLEDAGVVKRTGDVHKIGDKDYVMLEVLVSEKERIKICGGCNLWEAGVPEEKAADFKGWKRCSRCNQTYYCSESVSFLRWFSSIDRTYNPY